MPKINFRKAAISTLLLSTALLSNSAFALVINLNPVTPSQFTGTQGLAALAGFQEAASYWESAFTDNVTLNFDIKFDALPTGVVGSTGSTSALFLYQNVAVGMINDQTSFADTTANNNLSCVNQGPAVCAYTFLDTESVGTTIDADGTVDNITLGLTQANAKALGFTEDDNGSIFGTSADAEINFSSSFAFDFDRTDGIDSNKFDFVGVAIHEIGHALGFTSGVDTYDNFLGFADLDDFVNSNTLDLFRYSADSMFVGSLIGTQVLDFRPGANTYFSVDGGVTQLAKFSTGRFNGDGQQASHWKDNLGLGILDPTVGFGESLAVTDLDLLAFDVIGWDLANPVTSIAIPAPGVLFLLLGSSIFLVRCRKN